MSQMSHTCHTKWTNSKKGHGAVVKRCLGKKQIRSHIVGACAFETHMDISQGNFYAKNAAKKPKARWSTLLDLTAAFNTYGKKPFSVDTRKKNPNLSNAKFLQIFQTNSIVWPQFPSRLKSSERFTESDRNGNQKILCCRIDTFFFACLCLHVIF